MHNGSAALDSSTQDRQGYVSTFRPRNWAGLLFPILLGACNLPGIPLDETTSPEPLPVVEVCTPNARTCSSGNTLQVCAPDGSDFDVRVCDPNATCNRGMCLPVRNTCEADQPFSFSASSLKFQVRGDYKSQTAALTVANCSEREIVIEQAVVRGPERPDGEPVFALGSPFAQRIRIRPGHEATLTVVYAPVAGLAQVEGSLDLGITSDAYGRYSIPLRTQAFCATATPRLDFDARDLDTQGQVGSASVWLQNCGTEPLRVTEVVSGLLVESAQKLPLQLGPAQHLEVEVFAPDDIGEFESLVVFKGEEGTLAHTAVRGSGFEPECVSGLAPPPMFADVEVRKSVAFNDAPDRHVRLVTRPDLSRAALDRSHDRPIFQPDVVGTYRFENRWRQGDALSCEASVSVVEAQADEPFLVELIWENIGDRIPEDGGPGRGVNLDLHVLTRVDTTTWKGPNDCFVEQQSCAANAATMVSSSDSGNRPEAVWVQNPDATFDVAVHLANGFGFPGAQATVRIFAYGELVAQTSRLLLTANEFWWVGRWASTKQEWTEVNSAFDGVPR